MQTQMEFVEHKEHLIGRKMAFTGSRMNPHTDAWNGTQKGEQIVRNMAGQEDIN